MNLLEHLIPFYSGKPEAVSICIIIAGAPAMAFNEGSTAEFLQAGTRGCQGLARALCTSAGVLGKSTTLVTQGLSTSSATTSMNSLTQMFLYTSLLVLCSAHLLFCCSAQGGMRKWSWRLQRCHWVLSLNSSMIHQQHQPQGSYMHKSPSGQTAGPKLSLCKQHGSRPGMAFIWIV